ncbi:tetratricopeptide repeat protein [Winogradskyella sp.]|jgi:tetratricopeptide (TPR) repeat protein|uniref:tetratricopeptide repeat protein n=1 Tax=Winogradskyella sp. TaxID=1883156 RepID=UPI0025CD6673|nr:tetratricopeptide repeat protein [Winogradskyella sp.]MCT4628419.1 tetratricopeptide repeat protein [Winogradskyella sp.]
MKLKALIIVFTVALLFVSCAKSVEYSGEFKRETSGKYLYNPDELILVFYEDNTLRLNWKGGDVEPVALAENEFFVADLYSKFRFVQHPKTKKWYLSMLNEDEEKITYDYVKVGDDYKTPSQYLEAGNYEKALKGYLEIKRQDSTSSYINEWDFNRKGYKHLGKKEYEKAIGVFKLNAKLHPNSNNVYDSLAEAYLKSGDSLQAYNNYKIALEMNPRNQRAERFVKVFKAD